MMKQNQTSLQTALRPLLPESLVSAKVDLWDNGPLWGRESAKPDFQWVFRADPPDLESNIFVIKARPFPGIGSWNGLGRFPGHYYDHVLLINYMHAWCRDLLELGRWELLDSLKGLESGFQRRESATRIMRYLSRLIEEFLSVVDGYRQSSSEMSFPITMRIPTIDLHLLALFNECQFSQDAYYAFLNRANGRHVFDQDPILLSKCIINISVRK
jgi:hypothetical protein